MTLNYSHLSFRVILLCRKRLSLNVRERRGRSLYFFHCWAFGGIHFPASLKKIPRIVFHFRAFQSVRTCSTCDELHDLVFTPLQKWDRIKEYL